LRGRTEEGDRAGLWDKRVAAHSIVPTACATPYPKGVRKNALLSTGYARPHKGGGCANAIDSNERQLVYV